MSALDHIREAATALNKTVVLPEIQDIRTLKAAVYLTEEQLAKVILVGKRNDADELARKEGLKIPFSVMFIDPTTYEDREKLAEYLFERRKSKGMTKEQAQEWMLQPLFFAAGLVATGKADACVAGAVNTTGDVLRAAIQVIGLKPGSSVVSSIFLMNLPDGRTFSYGDCAVVPYPNTEQLASIAIDSAETHKKLTGKVPKLAMLSFSTKGSASHERVQLVREAIALVKERAVELDVDGELQFDAALIPEIGSRKAPGSTVAGNANVFIFPNLDAGNIAYKITERLGGATATGPIIQGLAKPMNDLSRGCSWMDIVNTTAVSLLQ